MRGHKFIIIATHTGGIEGEFDSEVNKQINYVDDDHLQVVTCTHEKLFDNIVTIKLTDDIDFDFIRDIEGRLWYFTDAMSRLDIIKYMEQGEYIDATINCSVITPDSILLG